MSDDMSWLDEPVAHEETAPEPAAMLENPTLRGAYFGILGTAAGAAAGALASIVLSSIFSSSCFADSCVWSYLRACSVVGAIAGMLIGAYLGKASDAAPQGAPGAGKRRERF